MKTCPQCGFHHTDLDERCARCGTYLDSLGDPDPLSAPGREIIDFEPGRVPRRRWEAPGRWLGGVRRRLFIWREKLRSGLPEDVHERNPWVAGALSLIPGLGQLYNHQPKKAALIFSFVAAVLVLAAATIFHPLSNYVLLGCLLAMIYSFHDGFKTAKQINRDYVPWQRLVAFYFAWILYLAIFALIFQYAACHFLVQFRQISGDIGNQGRPPVLRKGERVVVDLISYGLHRPRVGDLVLYDPPRLIMENVVTANMTSINPTSMIERVVAGPGQTFQRRAGVFCRDGEPVGPAEQPLVQDQAPWDFSLTAPKDCYIILFSYTFGQDWLTGAKAPRITAPGWAPIAWPQACVVPRSDVVGKIRLVYQPPRARRIVK